MPFIYVQTPKSAKDRKAVLISGPPGIGKSTAAHLVSHAEGRAPLELNASDVRNKSAVSTALSSFAQSHGMAEYSTNQQAALIFDEVDGMSGGDRGGIAELIKVIKTSKVPIICICNDRSHPKIKSLANYCLDLRFQRPSPRDIGRRLCNIAQEEHVQLSDEDAMKLAHATNCDIRHAITLLQMWRPARNASYRIDAITNLDAKTIDLGPFDAIDTIFKDVSIDARMDSYFVDTGIMPLFVQENYARSFSSTRSSGGKSLTEIDAIVKASESIALGDVVDQALRTTMNFKLAPIHAIMSCVGPGFHTRGTLGWQSKAFPSWLGKNSTRTKNARLLGEIASHLNGVTSSSTNKF